MAEFHVFAGSEAEIPEVRRIGISDVVAALKAGAQDFAAMPSHLILLGVLYPLVGVGIAAAATRAELLHLIFPLAAGFALIGPVAATFLYQMSRRREHGLPTDWAHAFDVLRSPSLPALAVMSVFLAVAFGLWVLSAEMLYVSLFGDGEPTSMRNLLETVISTSRGQTLFLIGGAIGFVFAAMVFITTVISVPLLLDRDVGLAEAVRTSVRAVAKNPTAMAAWALIIAACLVLGSAPLLIGLAIVTPILGHASWHLYRRTVVAVPAHENPVEYPTAQFGKSAHFLAGPHSVLFKEGPSGE